jgi:hypothetical protein
MIVRRVRTRSTRGVDLGHFLLLGAPLAKESGAVGTVVDKQICPCDMRPYSPDKRAARS